MPIDSRIALGYQAPQIESPVNMMAMAQKLQAGQQENQLRGLQMNEYTRNAAKQNALQSTLAGFTPDMPVEQQVAALQRGGHLSEARLLAESASKVNADARAAETSRLTAESERLKIRGSVYGSVAATPTVENAHQALTYLLDNKLVDPNAAQEAWAKIQANPTPENIRAMATNFRDMSVSAKDQLDNARLTAQNAETLRHNQQQERATVRGQDITAQTAANRLDFDKSKFSNGVDELAPKEMQKREAAYPKVSGAYRAATQEVDSLAADIAKLKDHPGLSGITGVVSGRTLNVTGEARQAQAILDRILAKGQFRGLQAMREASPTGGALGNVSDKEGAALRAAFGALTQTQDTKDFKSALESVLSDLKFAKSNLAQTYDDTYSYREGRAPASRGATPAAAPAALSPQDVQALDWAKSNPKDPRAAEIRQRLGQ